MRRRHPKWHLVLPAMPSHIASKLVGDQESLLLLVLSLDVSSASLSSASDALSCLPFFCFLCAFSFLSFLAAVL
jgi:hypothetical protein